MSLPCADRTAREDSRHSRRRRRTHTHTHRRRRRARLHAHERPRATAPTRHHHPRPPRAPRHLLHTPLSQTMAPYLKMLAKNICGFIFKASMRKSPCISRVKFNEIASMANSKLVTNFNSEFLKGLPRLRLPELRGSYLLNPEAVIKIPVERELADPEKWKHLHWVEDY